MQDRYRTLHTIYEIVKNDPHPLNYLCSTRDIILRHQGGWQQDHLDALAQEELIVFKKMERLVICITQKGFETAKASYASLKQSV
ncbi:MAG: hypothetical protein QM764_00190 [Chitinophagaceae bacterium]